MMKRLWLFLLALSGSPFAQAAMEYPDLFKPSSQDLSIDFLGKLFGVVDASISLGSGSQIMGAMFSVLNTAALSVAIILVVYAVFVGTMNSAGTGRGIGEKMSSLWLPLRMTFGTALLLPKANGYCLAQTFVMWLVVQGVGVADTVWSASLDYLMKPGGTLYTQNSKNKYDEEAKAYRFMEPLMGAVACVVAHNNDEHGGGHYEIFQGLDDAKTPYLYFGYPGAKERDKAVCGRASLAAFKTVGEKDAVQQLAGNLVLTAQKYEADKKLTLDLDKWRIEGSAKELMSGLALQAEQKTPANRKDLEKLKNGGWLLAGNYYRILSKLEDESGVTNLPTLTVEQDPDEMRHHNKLINPTMRFVSDVGAAHQTESATSTPLGQQIFNDVKDSADGMGKHAKKLGLDKFSKKLAEWFIKHLNGEIGANGDPLEDITHFGKQLMTAASSLIIAMAGVIFIGATATGACDGKLPFGHGFRSAMFTVMPLIYGVAGFLYAQGALLGVYIPLIPFIVFLFGTITWFIFVIEAMVAAPLVAIGLIWPEAQSEVLGKAEQGTMLILNLFLRPALMIIGFIAGLILCWLSITLIKLGFKTMMEYGGFGMDPIFGIIVLGMAYTSTLAVAVTKSFSLIHVVPDRVLNWIGDHSSALGGADEALSQTRDGASQAGHAVAGMASSASHAGEIYGRGQQDRRGEARKKRLERGESGPKGQATISTGNHIEGAQPKAQ